MSSSSLDTMEGVMRLIYEMATTTVAAAKNEDPISFARWVRDTAADALKADAEMITIPVTERHPDGTVTHTSFEMEAPQGEPIDDDFWCECGNPSEQANYHEDEFEDGERVSKHHWTCADCNRVTQVG